MSTILELASGREAAALALGEARQGSLAIASLKGVEGREDTHRIELIDRAEVACAALKSRPVEAPVRALLDFAQVMETAFWAGTPLFKSGRTGGPISITLAKSNSVQLFV